MYDRDSIIFTVHVELTGTGMYYMWLHAFQAVRVFVQHTVGDGRTGCGGSINVTSQKCLESIKDMMDESQRTGIFIIFIAISLLVQVQGRSLSDFIQFGPNFGDNSLPPSNDAQVDVQLQQPIPFLGQTRETLTVSLYLE